MYTFNKPYVRTSRTFTPVYMPGETYSFYFNYDGYLTDSTVVPFCQLWLIDGDGNQVAMVADVLDKVYIAGAAAFHIWKVFVFPNVKDGEYYFQIYDTISGLEKARSNIILSNNSPDFMTCTVKFRHNDVLFNTYYQNLPDFYQMFRLPLNQISPIQPTSTRENYRESSNGRDLRTSKSFLDMKIILESYWFDDETHQAIACMLEHREVYINGFRIINLKQIETSEISFLTNLSKNTFEILLDEYSAVYPSIETWGTIIRGGNTFYKPNNFIDANP